MQVDNIAGQAAMAPTAKKAQLGQSDFLQLMTAQFQNQDPFKPMENGDFLGQMAQFSTVSGLQDLNDKFSGLASSIGGDQALQAASLIGRDVLVAQEHFQLNGAGDEAQLAFETDKPAEVVVDIHDASGQLVRSMNVSAQEAGVTRLSWDGRDNKGEAMTAGAYEVSVRELGAEGSQSLSALVGGHIEAVSLGDANGTRLRTPQLGEIDMSAVRTLY